MLLFYLLANTKIWFKNSQPAIPFCTYDFPIAGAYNRFIEYFIKYLFHFLFSHYFFTNFSFYLTQQLANRSIFNHFFQFTFISFNCTIDCNFDYALRDFLAFYVRIKSRKSVQFLFPITWLLIFIAELRTIFDNPKVFCLFVFHFPFILKLIFICLFFIVFIVEIQTLFFGYFFHFFYYNFDIFMTFCWLLLLFLGKWCWKDTIK